MQNDLYKRHVFDNAVTHLGSYIAFDITELFSNRISGSKDTLAFSVCVSGSRTGCRHSLTFVALDLVV